MSAGAMNFKGNLKQATYDSVTVGLLYKWQMASASQYTPSTVVLYCVIISHQLTVLKEVGAGGVAF